MRCAKCGSENPVGKKFCGDCGASLANRCSQCGADNPPDKPFCGDCGAALLTHNPTARSRALSRPGPEIATTTEQAKAPTTVEGERKTVTALFADIKGSTELMREIDPEEARAVIDPVLQLMMDAVHRYDGYVVQSAGDGIFALFGAPVAHEDHPQRAVHAAIAMRDALRRRDVDLPGRPAAEVRIGINTGEVVMRLVHTGGHTEYTPVGHAANLAARMQSVAPAGGIVISEDTRRLVEGYFELHELGPTEVKGVAEPVKVYEVLDAGQLHGHFDLAMRRGLTKFIGREGELKQMVHALELAHGGHGQIVAVGAEAGTGKSRLFCEFKATLPAECKVLEAYSVSHGKASAWLPVLELLHDYFGIQEADDPATRREKVRAALAALDPVLWDTQSYLFALLAIPESPDPLAQMNAQIKRKRMMEALKRIVLRESLKQPIVIIFEDLHWIDDQTQALLDVLADGIANAHVLMLVNYRPEYRHEWTNKSYHSQLRLDALGRKSATEMLSTLLGDGVELNPIKRLIIERAEGNPFFIEEMVQALFDQGAIVHNGAVKVARSLSQVRLPPTVQGLLASRIDRLSPAHKELVQMLAVMGRESPLALIKQVASPGDEELEPALSALQASEFIYEQPTAAGIEYTFKHALIQEVAYNSLLSERRKLLHELAGAALESLYALQLDDHLSELAHHYRHTDNASKAIEYLQRAGQQAMQRSAHGEAISSLTAAIDLVQQLPDSPDRIQRELHLQLAISPALMVVKGFGSPEMAHAFTRAHELCEGLDETPEFFPTLWGLWLVHWARAELPMAVELAKQLIQQAQQEEDRTHLLLAHLAQAENFLWIGEMLSAHEQFEMALSFYDRDRQQQLISLYYGHDAVVRTLGVAALVLGALGYPEQAFNKVEQVLALADELHHPQTFAFAQLILAMVYHDLRQASATKAAAETLITFSEEQGWGGDYSGVPTIFRGWAMASMGNHEEGIAVMRQGLAMYRTTGVKVSQPYLICPLAEACVEAGRLDEGLAALTEASTAVERNGNHYYEPEMHRVRGELALKRHEGNVAEAEACFRRAIEVARKQHARIFELRAANGLARLLALQDKRDEARTMLAEIYSWFTEGFDTADLKDAKALLDELSA
jgi:class 3 adenylate cyclase/predicted ATPase